ncbi:MAG: hypothetical protein ABSH20_01435 [Tepidisphaeraceae bacterium]|jgi:hypothetical protein
MGILKKIFSKRQKPPVDTFTYELNERARSRIIHSIVQLCGQVEHPSVLFEDVLRRCLREYGAVKTKVGHRPGDTTGGAVNHFFAGDDMDAVDFLEMLFQSPQYRLGQDGVSVVNEILREEGIGYEFSSYVVRDELIKEDGHGVTTHRVEIEYPEAIKKTNEQMHVDVIVPCMTLLSGAKWKIANQEMLEAHRAFREGRLDDANTACGRCFETVLKTVCAEKRWRYDLEKDAVARLLDICREKDLFPPFYVEIFKSTGTVRNKLGGHGKGPQPLYQNDEAFVAHLLHQTSAHIVLLAKLAGMQ